MLLRQFKMIVVGVICGSMLFGSFLPKLFKKVDVTEMSIDHNPGTANAMKYAGVPVGILCLAADLLKGALPVFLAAHMELVTGFLFPLIMAAPVFGHAYSVFHRGKGGKAIAVSFGVMIGLLPDNYTLLVSLCSIYIISSVVMIRPHTKRTRITFLVFGIMALVLFMKQMISKEICIGALLIAGIVIHKNSVHQQSIETLREEEQNLSLENI